MQDNIYMLQIFGTSEEIEEEINDWHDLGRLEQKANQFKPKLDKMQEEIVARKLAEQEYKKNKKVNKQKNIQIMYITHY